MNSSVKFLLTLMQQVTEVKFTLLLLNICGSCHSHKNVTLLKLGDNEHLHKTMLTDMMNV